MTSIYFATNRNLRRNRPKNPFGKKLSSPISSIRFGRATLSGEQVKVDVAPEKLIPRPGGLDQDEKSILGSKKVFGEMRREMAESRRDALIHIHGFNTTFKENVRRAAELEARLGGNEGPTVALFSWPSNGRMLPWVSYASDRRDARASGAPLGRALLKLVEFLRTDTAESCERRVHLLANSMGCYLLRMALQTLIQEWPRRLPRLFGHVLLVAADEDEDAFECDHKLRRLPEIAHEVHVYFNRQDVALGVSDATKGNEPRLGDGGIRLPAKTPASVTAVDCTPVVHGLWEHGYLWKNTAVQRDVREVLRGTAPDEIANRRFVPSRNCYRLLEGESS